MITLRTYSNTHYMKKTIFLLTTLFVHNCYSQKIKTLNQAETLYGKVMMVINLSSSGKEDLNDLSTLPSDTTIYDKKGNIIERRIGSGFGGSTIVKSEYFDRSATEKKVISTSYTNNQNRSTKTIMYINIMLNEI